MSWKDILKELSDYERAVAEEFATDEDMERPDYSKTGPFAKLPEFPKIGGIRMPTVPKMGTKDSTTQDEDAKKRTEKNEAELLARLKARNQKSREEIGKQDPMMMEEMPPPPPPTGGPMPPPPPMGGMGMMPPPPMGMPPEQPEKPVVNPENASEFPVDPEQDDDMADKTGIRVKKGDWFSHVEKNVLSNFADRMMPSRVEERNKQAFIQSAMDMDNRREKERYGLTNQRFQEWANSNPSSYPDGSAVEGQVLPRSRVAMTEWEKRGGQKQVTAELYAKYPEPTRSM